MDLMASRATSTTLASSSPPQRLAQLVSEPGDLTNVSNRLPSVVPSIGVDQYFDIYETEIRTSLNTLGVSEPSALRPGQASAIAHALHNEDVFLSLATGAGKSLCFQVPALVRSQKNQDVTVVVLPTLEIISRQVLSLRNRGVLVETISSLSSHSDRELIAERIRQGYRPTFIYTTADTLCGHYSHIFNGLHTNGSLARIVLDEGHTVRHWADFKPSMESLSLLKHKYAGVPITIATASLTLDDRAALLSHLSIPPSTCRVVSGSLDRPNLCYTVRPVHSFRHETKMRQVVDFLTAHDLTTKCGLVFCSTSYHCKEVAEELNARYGAHCAVAIYGENNGMNGGMDRNTRQAAIQSWMDGTTRIIVATLSFGMGIDRTDVRFIIHYDLPSALESYIQEVGRAGRNGEPAVCLLRKFTRQLHAVRVYCWQDVQRTLFYNEGKISHASGPAPVITRLYTMSYYAHDVTTCRHIQLQTYLGAPRSQLTPCLSMCDNCINGHRRVTHDVTDIALTIVDMFGSLSLRQRGVHGLKRIINTLRGSTGKEVVPEARSLTQFGAVRDTPYNRVESVLQSLLAQGVLRGIPTSKNGQRSKLWAQNLNFKIAGNARESKLFESTKLGPRMMLYHFAAEPAMPATDEAVGSDDEVNVDDNKGCAGDAKSPTKQRCEPDSFDYDADVEVEECDSGADAKSATLIGPQGAPVASAKRKGKSNEVHRPRKRKREDRWSSQSSRYDRISRSSGARPLPRHLRMSTTREQPEFHMPEHILIAESSAGEEKDDAPSTRRAARNRLVNEQDEREIIEITSSDDGLVGAKDVASNSGTSLMCQPSTSALETFSSAPCTTTQLHDHGDYHEGGGTFHLEMSAGLAPMLHLLQDTRRSIFVRYREFVEHHLLTEQDVLSDRGLIALANERPADDQALLAVLTASEEPDATRKRMRYGWFFWETLQSVELGDALLAG